MDSSSLAVLLVMALVTFATRAAGPLAMTRTRFSPGLTRFLDGMAAAVIVALVTSVLLRGGLREGGAVAVACAVMALTKSAVWAMVAGAATAGLWTHFLA